MAAVYNVRILGSSCFPLNWSKELPDFAVSSAVCGLSDATLHWKSSDLLLMQVTFSSAPNACEMKYPGTRAIQMGRFTHRMDRVNGLCSIQKLPIRAANLS